MNEDPTNTRKELEDFRSNLQERVKNRISQPSTAETLDEQNKIQAQRKSPFLVEFRADKATYVFAAISAIFTLALGLILGLAPYRQGANSIYFNTDFLHWTLAIIYAVSFVAVTEVAFLIAKNKYHTREEGNPTQGGTMLAMMVLAGISVIGTGVSGGIITASVLGFLTEFQEIPSSAQKWVVAVIPLLLACYFSLLSAYKLSSEDEKQNRLTEQLKRKQEREHQLNRSLAALEVEELMSLAEDKAWLEAVERGALSAGEAAAQKKLGKSLQQYERERGEDFDGDNVIGPPPRSNHRQPARVMGSDEPDFPKPPTGS